MGARGNSGVIFSQILRGMAQALEQTSLRPCGDRSRGVLVNGPFNNIIGECPAGLDFHDPGPENLDDLLAYRHP
mgnify:CR=1 FL=1